MWIFPYILKAKKFAELPFQSKNIAEMCGSFLGHFGSFWVILEPFWVIFVPLWATLGQFGPFFGPFCGIFGTNLRKLQIFLRDSWGPNPRF